MIQLNLGCGSRPEPGWVNLDAVSLPGVDVVHDLDVLPWPFADGEAGEIKGDDVFEHVADPLGFMAECWRVLVPGGSLRLRTCHWQAENAYTDPTHRRFCTIRTFDYWCRGTEFNERYGAAYARGREFEKADVHVEGQELFVHLIRLGPEAVPVAAVPAPAPRVLLAWLMYCYGQGYKKPEERAGLKNWLGDDPATLHPDDVEDQRSLLEMADEILALL